MILTFALGNSRIPFSVLTSQLNLAFMCVPKITKVSNCFSVGVVISDFKAMTYITRWSTVSLIKKKHNKVTLTEEKRGNAIKEIVSYDANS